MNLSFFTKTVSFFATPGTFRNTEYKMARIVAVPGEKAELVGDVLTRYDISGSNFYKQYHSLDLMLEEAEKPFTELRKSIEDRMKNGGDQNALRKEYQEKAIELEKARNEKVMNYISQHATRRLLQHSFLNSRSMTSCRR